MARRPSQSRPERPFHTIEQKRQGIAQLERRIAELEAFDPQTVSEPIFRAERDRIADSDRSNRASHFLAASDVSRPAISCATPSGSSGSNVMIGKDLKSSRKSEGEYRFDVSTIMGLFKPSAIPIS
jgi:hypothetical protein